MELKKSMSARVTVVLSATGEKDAKSTALRMAKAGGFLWPNLDETIEARIVKRDVGEPTPAYLKKMEYVEKTYKRKRRRPCSAK